MLALQNGLKDERRLGARIMAVNDRGVTKVYSWSITKHRSPCCLCGRLACANKGLCNDCEADLPTLSQPQRPSALCRCALPLSELIIETDDEELAPLCARCLDQPPPRSEEHTSELQSRPHLVCRLLLEK